MNKKLMGLVIGLSLLFSMGPVHASVLVLDLDFEFSGATPPAGAVSWATATFDDSFGGANTVRLTMSASGLVGTEFIDDWLFNFDSALDPTLLSFAVVGTPGSTPNSIVTGVNAFLADGDGLFDIKFDFPPPPGDFAAKFTGGDTVVYDITYVSAISASSFDFGSAPSGGTGTFKSAALIQGIGPSAAMGWIAPSASSPPGHIPEPTTLVLMGLGLAGIGYQRKRSKTTA